MSLPVVLHHLICWSVTPLRQAFVPLPLGLTWWCQSAETDPTSCEESLNDTRLWVDACCQTLTVTHWKKTIDDADSNNNNNNHNNRIIVVSLLQLRCPDWVSWCEEWWDSWIVIHGVIYRLITMKQIRQSDLESDQHIASNLQLPSPLLHFISPLLISEDRETDERMDRQINCCFWWVFIISRKKPLIFKWGFLTRRMTSPSV